MRIRTPLIIALSLGLGGLVRADYVTGLDPGGDHFLALRSGPGTSFAMMQQMGPNTELTVLEVSGNWRRVQLIDGTTGWAYGKFIAAGTPPVETLPDDPAHSLVGQTGAALAQVTLRATVSDSGALLGTLQQGGGVIVLGQTGDWLRVLTESGALGYVHQGEIAVGAMPTATPPTVRSGSGKKSSTAATDPANWTRYVNPRFGTAIDFPAALFVPDPPPENGDGRSFRSVDGLSEFMVYAHYNAKEQSLIALREDDRTSDRYDSVTYERTGDGWYVLSGFIGDRVYYRRVLLTGGGETVHVFEITYPALAKSDYDPFVTRMSGTFTPPP